VLTVGAMTTERNRRVLSRSRLIDMTAREAAPRRSPAGAAVLQSDVTEALREAAFAELAEVGYSRLSIESVARRAEVGKTALYRRWPNKQAMVIALVSEVAIAEVDMPDTGSLRGDVIAFLRVLSSALAHPLARTVIPDLLNEANRNPALAEQLLHTVRDPRRERAAAVVHRAIARGELRKGTDVELALDVLAGPLYWRMAIVRTPIGRTHLTRLAGVIVRALSAA
jgi:AcrR family transcriptional regulator